MPNRHRKAARTLRWSSHVTMTWPRSSTGGTAQPSGRAGYAETSRCAKQPLVFVPAVHEAVVSFLFSKGCLVPHVKRRVMASPGPNSGGSPARSDACMRGWREEASDSLSAGMHLRHRQRRRLQEADLGTAAYPRRLSAPDGWERALELGPAPINHIDWRPGMAFPNSVLSCGPHSSTSHSLHRHRVCPFPSHHGHCHHRQILLRGLVASVSLWVLVHVPMVWFADCYLALNLYVCPGDTHKRYGNAILINTQHTSGHEYDTEPSLSNSVVISKTEHEVLVCGP